MRYLILLLLLAVNVCGTDLDSTRQARVQVYSWLGLDTTGTKNLPTARVDDNIYFGIQQVNNDLAEYNKVDLVTTADGERYVTLDSVVRLVACQMVSNDSIVGIDVIHSQDMVDSVLEKENSMESDEYKYSEYVYEWGDSLGFVPTPIQIDTFQVHYIHVIPEDSIQFIRENDRVGVVYWGAFLSATDVSSGKAELFLQMYKDFVASRLK